MKTLLVAIGNPLRGDDGVASRVIELLGPLPEVTALSVIQPTPELAERIASMDRVVFIDADAGPGKPRLEPVEGAAGPGSVLGHAVTPGAVITLARKLYDFRGQTWLCRVPVQAFDHGAPLTLEAETHAGSAARLLRRHLGL